MSAASGDGSFPNTSWTLIQRIKSTDDAVARRALDDLCAQYHYPLYCYIRRRGLSHHDAQDVLHDFLAKLLRSGSLEDANSERGRLRALLSTSLSRFLINHHRDTRDDRANVSLDATLAVDAEQRYEHERFTEADSPERVFERKWAHELMRHVLRRLRDDYSADGNADLFRALRPGLIAGGTLRHVDVPAVAATLGMTEGALRVAFTRLLKDYRTVLTGEVRQTVATEPEVDAEITHMMGLLG